MKALQTKQDKAVAFRDRLTAFTTCLAEAGNGLERAGKLLVEMLKEDENAFEKILAEVKGITPDFLFALERIGHGELDWRLLTDPSPAAQRALKMGLPIEQQRKLIDNTVPVVRLHQDGGTTIEHKRISEMTIHEAARVIQPKGFTTPTKQVEIIREQEQRAMLHAQRYEIKGEIIIFHKDCRLTIKDLEAILAKVKAPVQVDKLNLRALQDQIQQQQVRA